MRVSLATEEYVVEGKEWNGPVFHNTSYDVGCPVLVFESIEKNVS
jgi:hypothetical protein